MSSNDEFAIVLAIARVDCTLMVNTWARVMVEEDACRWLSTSVGNGNKEDH